MIKHSGVRLLLAALAAATAFTAASLAVETHVWDQSEQADFARGTPDKISIRSDGRLAVAPALKELDSTTVPYLWAIVQDSKGTLYYAGGAPTGSSATVYALKPGEKPKIFGEVSGLEIHALAVDSQDRVYAAVQPDAKVYRLDGKAKPELFFDPKCKYIWSLAFDRAGNLLVATGDAGLILKVDKGGKGTEFARTNEAHARSMIVAKSGDLIVGTEPGGLVMRVGPKGETFVLYQTNKREVTAVAERDGVLYAASVGNRSSSVSITGAPPVLPSNPSPVTPAGGLRTGAQPPSLPPAIGSISASVNGGSEVYAIQPDGSAERIWDSSSEIVYSIAFDSAGRPLIATGNKGLIYRIDSPQVSTQLLNIAPTQVTALSAGTGGVIYAATGNVGNLYAIGPGLEAAGNLVSDVLDGSGFAYWGQAHVAGHGLGNVTLESRSGNLSSPQHDWSPWVAAPLKEGTGQIASPSARFLQYRISLKNDAEVTSIDVPFVEKNISPRIRQIEFAPVNYREAPSSQALERSTMPSGSPMTVSVPAVGQKRGSSGSSSADAAPAATLQYNKGFITARWSASDANSDPLQFKLELKREGETLWRLLKSKLEDRYFAIDTTAFTDGRYTVRVTATDEPGNTPQSALTASLESDEFVIDNSPPEITGIQTNGQLQFVATDALSWIDKAEYSVDGGTWIQLEPTDKVTDARTLHYSMPKQPGHIVTVRVFDDHDNVAVRQLEQ